MVTCPSISIPAIPYLHIYLYQLNTTSQRPAMLCYRKGTWTEEEDSILLSIVNACGPCHWFRVSDMLGTRTAKQCAERYYQHLRPGLNHGPLTSYECFLIDKIILEKGKCWAYIAKQLVNRSENKIKNWWYSRRYKQYRERRGKELDVRYPPSDLESSDIARLVDVPSGQGVTKVSPSSMNFDTTVLEPRSVQRYDRQLSPKEFFLPQSTPRASQNRNISFRSIISTMDFQNAGNADRMSKVQAHMHALPTSAFSQLGSFTTLGPNHHTAQYTFPRYKLK
ncbi:hypothetical protein AUEXF2481DRAFT_45022 [Aureobasidium subglaciale EXF-2481]|uniref:Uncharacterized protein n=1 Tax=Aureobasidium subglaciale (strain EXF-2481) TaxID=1043005 RepID=A0A074XY19_AURSE|nr:uncharacterized protein AUEXF2481DRAFT_45022 [Aureobasidium subglaciale EXF-2481]KEQ90463.1 hypothetical protein AUEXF2481DRAFT_45022 [Aureobasidium subglaciale EXF-2481]